jgi:hypothetical protein
MKFTAALLLFICTHFVTRSASAAIGDSLHKLLASDGVTDAEFGWSVDISDNTAIVGAWQDDDNGFRSGSEADDKLLPEALSSSSFPMFMAGASVSCRSLSRRAA